MSEKNKNLIIDIIIEIFANMLIALATYNVALYAEFPMTGFSGISLILYRLFHLPIGLTSIIMNIPVAIISYKVIGKKFLMKSIRCMIISFILMDYVAPLLPVFEGNRLIAALLAAVLSGFGYALIYIRGSSTGGSDFITMVIKAFKPHLNMGTITFIFDAVIILISVWFFPDLESLVYGFVINFIMAKVVDKVILGQNSGRMALIVTDKGPDICTTIDECTQRGSTILDARGGYKGSRRDVVMVAGSTKDIYQIRRAVKETDPHSFVILVDTHEVHGEGFRITTVAGDK